MLPYETIMEAQISLGRNLTFGERLWFDYLARKSDYILYCHNTLFLFIFGTLLPLPYVSIELMRSKDVRMFKIQPKVENSVFDMFNCYKKVVWTFVFAVGPSQLFSYPVIEVIYVYTQF